MAAGAFRQIAQVIDDAGLAGGVKKTPSYKAGEERTLADIVAEVDAKRGRGYPSVAASVLQLVAIQIRAVGPGLGLAKGILMRKPGIDKIQIPPSMLKISRASGAAAGSAAAGSAAAAGRYVWGGSADDDWVSLIVSAEFPSKSSGYVGKLAASAEGDEYILPKSFKPKAMSEMLCRQLTGLGVPRHIIDEYNRR